MRTGGKPALTVRGACFAAGLAFCLGLAYADSPVQVSIGDKAVSIRAADTSIRTVLEELSRHSNLAIVSQEPLGELVTVDIQEPSLPLAIHRLLRQKNYMLHRISYVATKSNGAPYSRLWIFSEEMTDAAWVMQPPPEVIEYQVLALSEKSGDRQEAMYGFGEYGGDGAVVYLQQGLSDPNKRVRQAAIESLAELGGTASAQALGLVLKDRDVSIRIDAVDALGEIGGQHAMMLL